MERFKLQLSARNPNTRSRSELIFTEGGHWEQNQGPNQTRRFAECLHRYCHIPWTEFSVLDVGCALGDALPVWREHYPAAKLFGCDVAESAVSRCRERYGEIATFFRASFEEIDGYWDVISCSNVLEHFEQHVEIAELLLEHCKLLLVLTPFGELKDGSLIHPGRDDYYHVATFFRDSFEDLIARNGASRVETAIFSCPGGGWGFTRFQRMRWLIGAVVHGGYIVQEPLQILYAMHNFACPELNFLQDGGRPRC